jgi:predicted enzyme related to lactoylglutathione lyase
VPRPVVHLELHTGDLAGAIGFYSELLDWRVERIEAAGRSYEALDLGLSGGVVECGIRRPTWLPYVVLLEPREGPAGWRSVVATPEAGEIALWQPKAPTPA